MFEITCNSPVCDDSIRKLCVVCFTGHVDKKILESLQSSNTLSPDSQNIYTFAGIGALHLKGCTVRRIFSSVSLCCNSDFAGSLQALLGLNGSTVVRGEKDA